MESPTTYFTSKLIEFILKGPLVVDTEGEDDAVPGLDVELVVHAHKLHTVRRCRLLPSERTLQGKGLYLFLQTNGTAYYVLSI